MLYTGLIKKAINFATKVHEIDQKQKRKGKDVAYIVHPLSVGLILAEVGAKEEVIVAGILHDTIEDSIEKEKVTSDILKEHFGNEVAQLVLDVTETDKNLPWEKRKEIALEHIKSFSHNSLLVKSADIIDNNNELVYDYDKDGDSVFARFNAPKARKLKNSLETISAILDCWPENPLASELKYLARELQMMDLSNFMMNDPAIIIEYKDYNEQIHLSCPVCKWAGTVKQSGWIEYYNDLFDVSCPICEKMLLIVNYPLVEII